jgi:hemerythrin-like domain-containing protein
MNCTDELRLEHGRMMKVFSVLLHLSSGSGLAEAENYRRLEKVMDFLRVYVDQSHHAKEEDIFFPAIREADLTILDGLVRELISEHHAGRGMVWEMEEALGQPGRSEASAKVFSAVASRYVGLFRQHIRKENGILFPAANEKLAPEIHQRVLRGFGKVDRDRLGEERRTAFHRLAEGLEKALQ